MRTHAVRGNRYAPESAVGGFGDGCRTLDAARTQTFDNLRIVNDVADWGDRAGALSGGFDDLEGAPNSPAVAQFLGNHDALGGLLFRAVELAAIVGGDHAGG
jgi:hypothetical protein